MRIILNLDGPFYGDDHDDKTTFEEISIITINCSHLNSQMLLNELNIQS